MGGLFCSDSHPGPTHLRSHPPTFLRTAPVRMTSIRKGPRGPEHVSPCLPSAQGAVGSGGGDLSCKIHRKPPCSPYSAFGQTTDGVASPLVLTFLQKVFLQHVDLPGCIDSGEEGPRCPAESVQGGPMDKHDTGVCGPGVCSAIKGCKKDDRVYFLESRDLLQDD